MNPDFLLGAYVSVLSLFLGVVLITRVPSTLHTPLMSATNLISGIGLVGAMIVLGSADDWWIEALAFCGVVLGSANVVGGYAVTDRMLKMFRRREPGRVAGAEGQK